jgi:regulator of protease activity HflC (stomatin/prohibitin superfamily)
MDEDKVFAVVVFIGVLLLLVGIGGCVAWNFTGKYNWEVYKAGMHGKAQLAHAQYHREIAVVEAKAKMEAAELLAKAEIKRAEGVAQANKIIGDSLKDNDAYLRYLWINNLENSSNEQIIYVPTEAGLPILEANRLNKKSRSGSE